MIYEVPISIVVEADGYQEAQEVANMKAQGLNDGYYSVGEPVNLAKYSASDFNP